MTGYFSKYVGGLPGAGLLILRAAVGVTAICQACAFLPAHESGSAWLWCFIGVLSFGGAALILGILTVFAGVAIGIAEISIACSLLPFLRAVSQSQIPPVFLIVTTLSVILIGPGAFSIDARLFGLREVKISRISPPADL